MEGQVLVSIITPVYNSEKYISETIQSVLNQTYNKWEMLIVDDCSTDQTRKRIEEFCDDRIHYFCLEKNSGAAVARNRAIDNAKGRILAFLDADDVWKPQKLEKQLKFMLDNHYGFTFSSYEIMKEKGNKIIQVPVSLNYSQFMRNTIIGTLTVMLDRQIVGDIHIVDVKKDHDSMTWARIIRTGEKAYGLNECLAEYRLVEGSISHNKFKAAKRHWKNCRQIERIPFYKCVYYFMGYGFNAVKKHFF